MRAIYKGVFRDGTGNPVSSGQVNVFLAGTSTAASIYTTETGTTAANYTTSGSDGTFTFYVDRFDYDTEQKFKLSLSKTGYTTSTWDNIEIDNVIIKTYTISDDKTVSTHIDAPKGVIYSVATGKTLTFTGQFTGTLDQHFAGAGSVAGLKTAYVEWFGTGAAGIHSALDSAPNELVITSGTYEDVTIDIDNLVITIAEGATFKTSAAGLVPAIKFDGCDNVEVRGKIIANGNKANNVHSYTESNIGAIYATVGFKDCTRLNIPSIYVYNAWHDSVAFENVDNSVIGDVESTTPYCRGILVYKGTENTRFGTLYAHDNMELVASGQSHLIRIGGTSGNLVSDCTFGTVKAVDGTWGGVIIERYVSDISIDTLISHNTSSSKIEDSSNINIGLIDVQDCDLNGFMFSAAASNVSNITVDRIVAHNNGESVTSSAAGVKFSAKLLTLSDINIGSIIATGNGNSTEKDEGVEFRNYDDPTSIIKRVNIGSIISNDNLGGGFYIYAYGVVSDINIGQVIASGNAVDMSLDIATFTDIHVNQINIGTRANYPTNAGARSLSIGGNGQYREQGVLSNTFDLSTDAGAGVSWSSGIPVYTTVELVRAKITEEITFAGGGAKWNVGTATNPDRWVDDVALVVVGTRTNINNYDGTDTAPFLVPTALTPIITPDAGTFTNGTVILEVVYTYMF